jgi:hypothetical protein
MPPSCIICSGKWPKFRLNVRARGEALLRWLALLGRGGVPAHIEEFRPLRARHSRARTPPARPSVHPQKSAYPLTWPQKDGVAYASPSDFPLLGGSPSCWATCDAAWDAGLCPSVATHTLYASTSGGESKRATGRGSASGSSHLTAGLTGLLNPT